MKFQRLASLNNPLISQKADDESHLSCYILGEIIGFGVDEHLIA